MDNNCQKLLTNITGEIADIRCTIIELIEKRKNIRKLSKEYFQQIREKHPILYKVVVRGPHKYNDPVTRQKYTIPICRAKGIFTTPELAHEFLNNYQKRPSDEIYIEDVSSVNVGNKALLTLNSSYQMLEKFRFIDDCITEEFMTDVNLQYNFIQYHLNP